MPPFSCFSFQLSAFSFQLIVGVHDIVNAEGSPHREYDRSLGHFRQRQTVSMPRNVHDVMGFFPSIELHSVFTMLRTLTANS
jgi:hypothetical protein